MEPSISERYKELRDKLNYDAGHFSSVARQTKHPAFREIVELGKDVVPVILNEFDRYDQTDEAESFPGWWAFSALCGLTGEDMKGYRPGVLSDLVSLWLAWGVENGYLAKDRPRHEKTPPVIYKGWIVVGLRHGEESVLCKKRDPRNAFEAEKGTAAWVTKRDHATPERSSKDWWKKYAWVFDTKEEAEAAIEVLNEKIKTGECSEFNKPDRAWVEEI